MALKWLRCIIQNVSICFSPAPKLCPTPEALPPLLGFNSIFKLV